MSCGRNHRGTCVSIQRDANLWFWCSRCRKCWRGDDRSVGGGRRPNRLRPAWSRSFRSLLLTECDGEKKCLSQQQNNGFPEEHRPHTTTKTIHRLHRFLCGICGICGSKP